MSPGGDLAIIGGAECGLYAKRGDTPTSKLLGSSATHSSDLRHLGLPGYIPGRSTSVGGALHTHPHTHLLVPPDLLQRYNSHVKPTMSTTGTLDMEARLASYLIGPTKPGAPLSSSGLTTALVDPFAPKCEFPGCTGSSFQYQAQAKSVYTVIKRLTGPGLCPEHQPESSDWMDWADKFETVSCGFAMYDGNQFSDYCTIPVAKEIGGGFLTRSGDRRCSALHALMEGHRESMRLDPEEDDTVYSSQSTAPQGSSNGR
jgi:hypothetical protein